MLRALIVDGLESDIFIANVLMCRPPVNHKPEPDQISACLFHLVEIARILRPRLIVAVGIIARDAIMPGAVVRGKYATSDVMPDDSPILSVISRSLAALAYYTWHPSYLLHHGITLSNVAQAIEERWQPAEEVFASYSELRQLINSTRPGSG
jgi:uracil-DNA glycosylase family 4